MSNTLFVITGANKGLGLCLAQEASSRGFTVEGISKSPRSAELPSDCNYTSADLSDPIATETLWKTIREKYPDDGSLVLINNAGIYHSGPFSECTFETVEANIRANFFTAVNSTKSMMQHFSRSRIINIISTSALVAKPTNAAYGSSKAAMAHFFRSLQMEYESSQYQVSNIYPGSINTWSKNPEPDTIAPHDLARFLVDLGVQKTTFWISECTVLPSTYLPEQELASEGHKPFLSTR